jgi:predicted permease
MRLGKWLYTIPLRLRSLFGREQVEKDLNDELRDHLERRTGEYVAKGMAPEEARRRARLDLGGIEQTKEKCRDARRVNWIQDFVQDLRFAARTLRKSPGFTTVAVLTLALGIGANTAMFSVVEGVLLAPLPYSHPDRLVVVWENNLHFKQVVWPSYPNFKDWQRSARAFQQMAAVRWRYYDLTSPGSPEHVLGAGISSSFLDTLDAKLPFGRNFSSQEDQPGGAPVVIISNQLWRNRFAGNPQALGKAVTLNGVDYTVIGILPPRFHFGDERVDVYTPLAQGDPLMLDPRGAPAIVSIARLNSGVSMAQAQAEMSAIQDHLVQRYPDANKGLGVSVVPLRQVLIGDVSGTLLVLLGAVSLVLLIACANVANLLLARSVGRTREFAIRAALGASRSRTVRQLLTESTLLSLGGAALGLTIANWGVRPVLTGMPGSLPRSEDIGVNTPVLLFTLAVSIAVAVLFGLAPALKNSKTDLQSALKEGGRGATTARHRVQSSLVILQMALTLMLLMGAGLLFRTIHRMSDTNPGFDTQHVITFKVGFSPSVTKTASDMRTAYRQLLERLRTLPGVQAADFTYIVPLKSRDNVAPFWIGSQMPAVVRAAPRMMVFDTGPDYLRAMSIPLLRGRFFTEDDTTKSPCVAAIDDVLASTYFRGQDPLGQTITFGWTPPWGPCRIVGVVGHVRHWGLGNESSYTQAQAYYPLYQIPDQWVTGSEGFPTTTIIVRTPLPAAAVIPAIKNVLYGIGKDQPIYSVESMEEIASESMSAQRFPMILLGIFAALALLLASVGIYGVISYSVTQRVHEIGIRMALGAHKRDVFRMVVGQGLALALAGLAIGVVAALILTRVLSSFSLLLYGVGASDPVTFITVSVMLLFVAVVACYLPTRRAMRVDPMVALRHE